MTGCVCKLAGFCERHQVNKTDHLIDLCQSRTDYWQAWEDKRGPGQLGPKQVGGKAKKKKVANTGIGPGTELSRVIKDRGYTANGYCGCTSKVQLMNRWGVEGCRTNLDTIIDWLEGAAKKAGWLERLAVTVPGVRSLARIEIKAIINEAIDRAERNAAAKAAEPARPRTLGTKVVLQRARRGKRNSAGGQPQQEP